MKKTEKAHVAILARRNLRLMTVIKPLTMRVYLPLIAIYATQVSGMNLKDIGVLLSVIGAIKLVSEVPTGYFADMVSRRGSYMIGAVFACIGVAVLITMQSKTGVYVALSLEAIGYAFFSGTNAAFIHDTLVAVSKDDEYTRYSSRIQSVSLLANAGLIALVPLTYSFDPRLPFIAGCLQFVLLFGVSFFLKDLRYAHPAAVKSIAKKVSVRQRLSMHKEFMMFACVFGLFGATYVTGADFRSLAMEEFGVRASLLGLVFAAASVVGAAIGPFVRYLRGLPLRVFALIDVLVCVATYGVLVSGSAAVAVLSFIVIMSFWRYRMIVYSDYILKKYPSRYKATLLSTLTNAVQLNRIWQPAAIGFAVGAVGLQSSFGLVAAVIAGIGVPFVLIVQRTLGR